MDLSVSPLEQHALKEKILQNKRLLLGLGLILLSGCCILSFRFLHTSSANPVDEELIPAQEDTNNHKQADEEASNQRLMVYVTGAVTKPGLIEIEDGKRLGDALAACGGFTPEADTEALNLARHVKDGEQIHVPRRGEQLQASEAKSQAQQNYSDPMPKPQAGKININTASKEELTQIPGIGPGLAGKIIADRKQQGSFNSVDDLARIKGLKGKKLEKIKPHVCV